MNKDLLLHKLRRTVVSGTNKTLERFGLYSSYTLSEDERVDVLDISLHEAYSLLKENGFCYEPVAALKKREDGRWSDGSFTRKYADYQLHVTLFELDEGVEFNAHYEYRWEPGYVDEDVPWYIPHKLVRTYCHYKGTYYDVEKGVSMLEEMLNS